MRTSAEDMVMRASMRSASRAKGKVKARANEIVSISFRQAISLESATMLTRAKAKEASKDNVTTVGRRRSRRAIAS